MSRPAIFLDRDGTLNVERGFVTRVEDLEMLPGVRGAVAKLAERFALVVVTNQSGIARGLYDELTLARIHERLQRELGGTLLAIFHCPHHPEGSVPGYARECACRKPGSALIGEAARLLDLDLARSFVVGDAQRDITMAHALGLPAVLVRSGKSWSASKDGARPEHVAADLGAAAEWITATSAARP